MATRQEIMDCARSFLGVRFRYHGRTREQGVDCVGLLVAVATELNIPMVHHADYGRGIEISVKLNEAVTLNSDPAPIKPLKGGQIVKLRQTVAALHTGILCFSEMGRTIIHASIESGKVIEDSLDQWKPMVLGLREFKGTVD
jgi:hypothetical protein